MIVWKKAQHTWDTWGQELVRRDFPEVYFVFRSEMRC